MTSSAPWGIEYEKNTKRVLDAVRAIEKEYDAEVEPIEKAFALAEETYNEAMAAAWVKAHTAIDRIYQASRLAPD